MRRFSFVVVFFWACATTWAAAARPMTPADLWGIRRPASPAVSPDGAAVAYQLVEWSVADNRGQTDVWLSTVGGGESLRLTRQPGNDSSPAWSADGRFIYFLSARGGQPAQVYRVPPTGGDGEKVTDLPEGVDSFQLAPDGRSLLAASTSFDDCADLACVRARRAAAQERKASGKVFDHLLYRHWNEWRGDERHHVYLVDLARGAAPLDLTPGTVDAPPIALGTDHDMTFAPDGRRVALAVNRAALAAASTDNDIELLNPANPAGPRETASPGDGNDVAPRFAADGQRLFWISQPRAGYESDRRMLMLREGPGKVRPVFEQPDLSVEDYELIDGGKAALFRAQDKGKVNLYRVEVDSGRVELLVQGGTVKNLAVAPGGGAAVLTLESLTLLPELYRLDLATGQLAPLTRHNAELARQLELGQPREMWFAGAAGERVHALVVMPPVSSRAPREKIPVVFVLHGGPQGATLDEQHTRWNLQQFAAFGYVVVAVNFHGSTGYGQRFTDSINKDWNGKPAQDVLAALDALRKEAPEADASMACAAGGSYGGYLVDWLLGHSGGRFRCFVSHAGLYDLRSFYGGTEELWFPEWDLGGPFWGSQEVYEKLSPSSAAGSFRTPTLVVHGELDFRVPVTQGMQLFTALQRQGVPSRFLYFPDEGHFVGKPANAVLWWDTIQDWFGRYLAAPAPGGSR